MDREAQVMVDCLGNQRSHVLGIVEGLSDEALRRPVLPSGWSILGLVHHLAIDVESFWFRVVVAGETPDDALEDNESAWVIPPNRPCDEIFDLYREEIVRADEIIAATALDAEPRTWPEFFGDWRLPNLRAILLHVIAETACHAGHLDATRELIDGRTWMVLT